MIKELVGTIVNIAVEENVIGVKLKIGENKTALITEPYNSITLDFYKSQVGEEVKIVFSDVPMDCEK